MNPDTQPSQVIETAAFNVMLNAVASAHSLCPTDMAHMDKMRWKAKHIQEALRAGLAQPSAEKVDMVWNSDDAEKPHDSIGAFLNDEICNGSLEVGAEFTLWQAQRLPAANIRVTSIDSEACEAEYEIIDKKVV